MLFACSLNRVRSPMAAACCAQMFGRAIYVGSAGVRKGELDPFAVAVMEEIGARHLAAQADHVRGARRSGGPHFDLIVTLSPEAHHRALELTRTIAVEVEYWPTPDPTVIEGSREQRLEPIARSATSCWRASASASAGRRRGNE